MLSLIYLNYICAKKSLKMPMEQSEAVIRMTDNCTMVKRKRKKRQTLNRKRTMEQNDPPPPKKTPNPVVNSVAPEVLSGPVQLVEPVVL